MAMIVDSALGVEIHVQLGLPSFDVVECPAAEVAALRDRVRSCVLVELEEWWPMRRVTVHPYAARANYGEQRYAVRVQVRRWLEDPDVIRALAVMILQADRPGIVPGRDGSEV